MTFSLNQQLELFPTPWEQLYSLPNLLLAFKKAKKGKSKRPDVAEFTLNLEHNLFSLHHDLQCQTYTPSAYKQFNIYDKKPRTISVAPFIDRVVHHAVMNIIGDEINRTLSPFCFACRPNLGVHAAVDYYQQQSKYFAYVLKLDIKQYFPSINHDILLRQCAQFKFDTEIFNLLKQIILNSPSKSGLPIGNLTSQWLANLYLSEVDQWLFEQKFVFLRYVDDIFVLGNNKKQLWQGAQAIGNIAHKLKLSLRSNLTQVSSTSEKVDVLGYKITPSKRWLRNANGHRFKRKLKTYAREYSRSSITLAEIQSSLNSWIGHAKHGETLSLRKNILKPIIFTKK